jgi:small subunit ribosomal protein S1
MKQANNAVDSQEEDFRTIWEEWASGAEYREPVRGDVRQGTVLIKTANEIIVDVGAKRDAVVPKYELDQVEPARLEAIKVGDKLSVYIVRLDDPESGLIVSIKRAREFEDWLRAEEMVNSGETFRSTITGYNRGGLLCNFGRLQAFVPASQISRSSRARSDPSVQPGGEDDALAALVGKELTLKVIEVNRRRRRLIVSARAAQQNAHTQQREQLLAELEPGQVRRGVVSSIRDFGVFVDLGGLDGLVHISELAWTRVASANQVLSVGQEVEVLVLHVDLASQRIGLSIKRLQPDPWTQAVTKYQPGQLVSGVVAHVAKFGAFVELEPGVEGLVHLSELADGEFGDPSNIVAPGQRVNVLVLSVEPDRHRVSLSLRQAPQS